MRRISLALALLGAVAAAGCAGGGNSNASGEKRGSGSSSYSVEVSLPTGGTIESGTYDGTTFAADGLIRCGSAGSACTASFGWDPITATTIESTTSRVLRATPDAGKLLEGWAGDCTGGDQYCALSGNADKFVAVRFSTVGAVTGHPNWSDGAVHSAQYRSFALQCNRCHGLDWTGQAMAPSCYGCHNLDTLPVTASGGTAAGGHFDPAAAPWLDHDGKGWDQACLRCHTNEGFRDYVGVDGTPNNYSGTFLVDHATKSNFGTNPPAAGEYAYGPLQCKTCHNSVTDPNKAGLTRILFPSGNVVSADPVTALCGTCHQARESTVSVNTYAGTLDPDAVSTANFINPHYLGAAATMYGADAAGWGQYAGKIYTRKNQHGVIADKCTSCHNPHTGDLPADADIAGNCGRCHFNDAGASVSSFAELEESRQFGFEGDIDGNGLQEGLNVEIAGLQAKLLEAVQAYATNVVGQGICFDNATYPYFLNHVGTGACTPEELALGRNGAFKSFTPRLMRAAFNMKFAAADPGAWAHNPRYAIEILFDSIEDLNSALGANAVAFSGRRTFEGHFGAAEVDAAGGEAFTDWNAEGTIGNACSMCHGADKGLTNYLAIAPATPAAGVPSITGFQCTTCHAPTSADTNFKTTFRAVSKIYFPPEKPTAQQFAFDPSLAGTYIKAADRVCMTCHAGRESMSTVAAAGFKAGWTNSFKNPHYLGAAGIMQGSNAAMMWQYGTNEYAGYPKFWGSPHGSPHGQSCTNCHQPQASKHSFEVDLDAKLFEGGTMACNDCHVQESYGDYRLAPLKTNIERLSAKLYATIQAYALANNTNTVKGVCYNGGAYPYWFKDTDGDGLCSAGESVSANGAKFDDKAAKAAFNYKWSQAEPGAYAHNYEYMAQAVIDSIQDLDAAAVLPYDAHFDPDNTTTVIERP